MALTNPDILAVLALVSGLGLVLFIILFIWQFNKAQAFIKAFNTSSLTNVGLEERLNNREEELQRLQEQFDQHQRELQSRVESLSQDLANRDQQLTRIQAELSHERTLSKEKIALLTDSQDKMVNQFKVLANEIFENKSQQFTDLSKSSLQTLLNPLQQNLQRFEKRVEESYSQESKERHSLEKEIKNLQALNKQISDDAINLTNALKGDNKAQGNWGEVILESVLERSGLVKGREYEVQVSLKVEGGGRSQPDVVVHLPESRDIIIDSKVSLKAWEEYCSVEDSNDKELALKQHVLSIRNHIKGLAAKDYQNLIGVNTLDYVFLFMPVEPAYSVAAQQDSELFQFAFERNIIIVVPTTLLTTLKTVQNIWRLVQQNENATEIAERAGALYDKFVGFIVDLDEVGQKIEATQKTYDKAKNKLHSGRGNLIGRVEKLKDLGAKTSKSHKSNLLISADDQLGIESQGEDD